MLVSEFVAAIALQMLKTIIVLLFCLTLIQNVFAQKVLVHVFMEDRKTGKNSDTIYYDPSRTLTWADFQGSPDLHHDGGAVTASGFAFNSDIRSTSNLIRINIGVYTFFSKKASWKKPNINSSYHLLHEQHHFDITRLGAGQFVSEISKTNFTRDNYQKVLVAVFDKVYNHSVELQHAYDAETNHSINQAAQYRWNDKIESEIKKL
ncbi:MAG: hypothetical protein ABJA57_05435 [Ginsengibacter sp.]